jgi:hypothetical protein
MKTLPAMLTLLLAVPMFAQDLALQPLAVAPVRELLIVEAPIRFVEGTSLSITLRHDAVEFGVDDQTRSFVGVVIVSPSAQLVHHFAGMPPMLLGASVLGWGQGGADGYRLQAPAAIFALGMKWYAQGVAVDAAGVRASDVSSFVLNTANG